MNHFRKDGEIDMESGCCVRTAAKTSEGPVVRKMVPLDDLKHCADLCIKLGWTLQEFRKNMDEWDEDTVDITETE